MGALEITFIIIGVAIYIVGMVASFKYEIAGNKKKYSHEPEAGLRLFNVFVGQLVLLIMFVVLY